MSQEGHDSRAIGLDAATAGPDGAGAVAASPVGHAAGGVKEPKKSSATLVPSLFITFVACFLFLGLFHIVWANDELHVIPKKNFTFCLTFTSLTGITVNYQHKPDLDAFHNDEHLDHLVRELVRRGVIKVR